MPSQLTTVKSFWYSNGLFLYVIGDGNYFVSWFGEATKHSHRRFLLSIPFVSLNSLLLKKLPASLAAGLCSSVPLLALLLPIGSCWPCVDGDTGIAACSVFVPARTFASLPAEMKLSDSLLRMTMTQTTTTMLVPSASKRTAALPWRQPRKYPSHCPMQ